MVSTPRNICLRAMKLINAIGIVSTPSNEFMTMAYQSLKELLDGWKVDRLAILTVQRAIFDLVSGQQNYTIGENGDFDRNRPVWLAQASVINNSSANYPLELPLSVLSYDEWQRVPVKNITSALPTALYYDYAFDAGLGNIAMFPVPNVTNLQVALYCPTPLEDFTSLDEQYDFPPSYLRAITFNLAIDIAPLFDIEPTPRVSQKAAEYLGDLRRANVKPFEAIVDRALISQGDLFDYYTGEPF